MAKAGTQWFNRRKIAPVEYRSLWVNKLKIEPIEVWPKQSCIDLHRMLTVANGKGEPSEALNLHGNQCIQIGIRSTGIGSALVQISLVGDGRHFAPIESREKRKKRRKRHGVLSPSMPTLYFKISVEPSLYI
ncbi:MAG: hypothetical protein K5893_10825 [Prevotella sp.]|nr:hypothetical protein [Prevotella sp.]